MHKTNQLGSPSPKLYSVENIKRIDIDESDLLITGASLGFALYIFNEGDVFFILNKSPYDLDYVSEILY